MSRQRVGFLLRVLFVSLTVLVISLTRDARAADVADEADLQFQLGADRYEAGDFKGALQHFLASNRLVPNKNVVFNIARTYEQLKLYPDAYRYYVDALDGETRPDSRKRIEEAAGRIRPNIALLTIDTEPAGATIFLDRRDLGARGATPRSLGMNAGTHKVIVDLAGYEPQEVDNVALVVGQERTLSLKLRQILGAIRVEGDPGATVHIDREDSAARCTIPCIMQITPGKHVLLASREGYKSAESNVEITANQTSEARFKLDPQSGTVVVNSDVRDAVITVDGETKGFTPAVLTVPVGSHRLRITQSGFRPVDRTVQVQAGQQVQLDAEFTGQEEVVAASRAAESVEDAPASVTIINREELRAFGYPTIAEAIRGVRGIYLSYDDVYSSPGVRGFSRPGDYGNRILVTVDGQPTNDNYIWSSYIGFDGRVDLDDVERIEIVRGAGSVVYGTGAFFGVINLVTRDRNNPTRVEGSVNTALGVARARLTGVYRVNDEAGGWISVAGAHGPGTDHFYPEYVSTPGKPITDYRGNPADGITRAETDALRAGTISGRVWWKSLTLQGMITSHYKNAPSSQFETTFGDPQAHNADTRGFLEARFEPKINEKLSSLTRAHMNIYRYDNALPRPSHAVDPTQFGTEYDTYRGTWGGIEQRFTYQFNEKYRLALGGEVIRHFRTFQYGSDEHDTSSYVGPSAGPIINRNDPFSVYSGYITGDGQVLPRLKISAGARIDYFEKLDFDTLSSLSPRVAFIIKPYSSGNVKVMFGKAFRAPSVYERFYVSSTQIAPSSLKPEQVVSGELEYSHRFAPTLVGTVAGFINNVTNLIELDTTNVAGTAFDQYKNSNADVLVIGGEAELRREWRNGWMASLSASVQKASYQGDSNLRRVPNSPLVLGSFKGAMPIIGRQLMLATRLSVEGVRYDRQNRAVDLSCDPTGATPQACPTQGTTEPAAIWDVVFTGELERWGARYAVGLYNAMDWKYDNVPSSEYLQRTITQPGRSVLASITAGF